MKVANSKLVSRMVSNTKRIRNKFVKNGREELENDDPEEIPSRVMKSKKSALKNSKLVYLKSQLSPAYKTLS